MSFVPKAGLVHQEPSPSKTMFSKETQEDEKFIDVLFEEDDRRNPMNFSRNRKWAITIMGSMFTFLAASSATSYPLGFPSMIRDLNCTDLQATLGLSMFALGFGVIPLVTSAFSEEFGRHPLYIISTIGFSLMHLMVALAPNIQTVIVARFLQGAFGSTGATVVAGTITDIWAIHERGLPMSMFSAMGIIANGVAVVAGGWIEMNDRLGWRWIQWIHLIIVGVYCILVPIVMRETRSAILLLKIADKLGKKNPSTKYRVRVYEEQPSLRTLIWISCTRPILLIKLQNYLELLDLLCTEPIVISNSLWIGFAWGIFYCMIHIGSILGFCTNFYQEKLYQKNFTKRGVEGRLYLAFIAAILFPVGMFIYAWTSRSDLPWIAPIIGITTYMWATYAIYVAVFTYIADCYGPYASSALAGQSLFRNLMGAIFPLFTQAMFRTLTYKWANTLFACIAVLMIPIPYASTFHARGP
ncbi:major facilitator superfamily domain-containing protein [Collybia nuda]|uniref:Major facilitator superfamily domain-containing protein n=1 Tax=Collybia nuda TaxID=64659 RepID=A0A9P6CHP0_9AGAR|nr:major facilitator superfamily domain-containing protein [Collybia nuda]